MLVHLPPALVDHARALHATPGRAYHTFEHVEEVLAWLDAVAGDVAWSDPTAVTLAALFHDCVYVAGRPDNEAASARAASAAIAEHLPAVDAARRARVEVLIELTARHGALGSLDVDDEAARFLDADMAILGASPARFDAYDRAIAVEYASVPPELFAAGRRQFLGRLLSAPRIYLSPWFHDRLDTAARANLRRALSG